MKAETVLSELPGAPKTLRLLIAQSAIRRVLRLENIVEAEMR